MGGDIVVASEEGKGTTFTADMQLDLAQEDTSKGKESVPQKEVNFAGKRVLLVEDHPLNTMVATRLLEKRGMKVIHAGNGKKGHLRFLKTARIIISMRS